MQGDWVLHVDRREAELRAEGGVLHVRGVGAKKQSVPLGALSLLVLNGSPRTDAFTLRALADAGVATVLVGGRQQQSASWLTPGLSGGIRLRHAQHLAYACSTRRLALARATVAAKLQAQAAVARQRGWPSSLQDRLLASADRVDACADLLALQGLEGAASAQWFEHLRTVIPGHWGFARRERRPPPCPTNAMLSYLYTVVAAEAELAAHAQGLDPALGFLHCLVAGRPALALDLMEVARPGVDALVVALLGGEQLTPSDFRIADGGCLMQKAARIALMQAFAEARSDWPGVSGGLREGLARAARDIAKAIDTHPMENTDDAAPHAG